MGRSRRSVSGGSYQELSSDESQRDTVRQLLKQLSQWRDARGQSLLHSGNLAASAALLTRLPQCGDPKLVEQWLTLPDQESSLTPLHTAIARGDLAALLLLLRQAAACLDAAEPVRLRQRPMAVLEAAVPLEPPLAAMIAAKDYEGLTPAGLLAAQQRRQLRKCRLAAVYQPTIDVGSRQGRRRRTSFDMEDEQDELNELSRNLHVWQGHETSGSQRTDSHSSMHGCEVFTFGRTHHCALGQDATDHKLRPQRVPTFAWDTVGREGGSATAVAGAAHHTLVVTAAGQLYAFGLGKGGRLGTGSEAHCPSPTRVLGALGSRTVISVAAAENHSLCVTACGKVYAWGSNRFGQLGANSEDSLRCVPRRVDDLKQIACVAVAAGAKHSVALSKLGEVYVWGCNAAGQLGVNRRNGTHKVQRVDALWNADKVATAIAASDQATLALTVPSGTGSLPVNSVYAWGHGNHVPSRVIFDPPSSVSPESNRTRRAVNPVAIACARYHNVCCTADGHVYTWGLHAESLGTKRASSTTGTIGSPQLVTGMLPENGGGFVVAVSASENHTAVVTDTGALFTWGATYGKNILGHEGVRWLPDPKRVPGVYRAVGVAAAKEHTVLLIGTSSPPLPPIDDECSLESLAAREVAKHMDLFNVLPSLVMAERAQSQGLIEYCLDFIHRNLDGVLNVLQKSVADCYLNEQLAASLLDSDQTRDSTLHPLFLDILLAGNKGRPSFSRDTLCSAEDWLEACRALAESRAAKLLVHQCRSASRHNHAVCTETTSRRPRSLSSASLGANDPSERCIELTENMDLSSQELAEAKRACLLKEMRWVRKRLSQITKLQQSNAALSSDERDKLARRPQLEADMLVFEPALELVEQSLNEFAAGQAQVAAAITAMCSEAKDRNSDSQEPVEAPVPLSLRCDVCQVTCPDKKSLALHLSGRKHRNRVAQVEEAEQQIIAKSLLEEKHRAQLTSRASLAAKPQMRSTKVAWAADTCASPTVKPRFNLPQPPVPVPDSVVSKKPVSLRDIMKEESKRAPVSLKPRASSLQLPKGAAPALKSPPWAASPPVTAVPASPTPEAYSLGDFLTPSKLKTAPSKKPSGPVWSSPTATATSAVAKPAASPNLSLLDIQRQESEFKAKEDQTFGSSAGKWYIERRERAESFTEIQSRDNKEREERLFIEEQYRIEQQIQAELRQAMAGGDALDKKRAPKKNKKKSGQATEKTGEKKQSGRPRAKSVTAGLAEKQPARKGGQRPRAKSTATTGTKAEAPTATSVQT